MLDFMEWRSVVGYEGFYEVSNEGHVRSLRRYRCAGRVLHPAPDKDGYLTVSLCRLGIAKTRFVHHLVLEAFVGLRPPGAQARHLNDFPWENRLENLAWGTRAENLDDYHRNGRRYWKAESWNR
jgi:hypothetical protein